MLYSTDDVKRLWTWFEYRVSIEWNWMIYEIIIKKQFECDWKLVISLAHSFRDNSNITHVNLSRQFVIANWYQLNKWQWRWYPAKCGNEYDAKQEKPSHDHGILIKSKFNNRDDNMAKCLINFTPNCDSKVRKVTIIFDNFFGLFCWYHFLPHYLFSNHFSETVFSYKINKSQW